jgi:esterase/lipase
VVPIVPSDLVEYPIINYFKFRNKGKIRDEDLSHSFISLYTKYYRKDPRKFFLEKFKPKLIKVNWSKSVTCGKFIRSTGQTRSSYRPLSPLFQDQKYFPVSRMLTYRYTFDDGKESTCAVLFIHGYAETTFFFHELSYFRIMRRIFKGDIFTLELPYHFHRQPTDSPFSGAYFLNGNPVRMLEAIRQSIQEMLLLTNYLKDRYDRIVIFGVSLGGHIAALTTQFMTDVEIICALASPFIFSLNPEIVPISTEIVSKLKKRRQTNWYRILYACNLKYFSPFTTNHHTTIIGGRYDRIVHFDDVKKLSTMLDKPLFSYPGGHLSLILWLRSLLNRINRYKI